MTRMRVVSVGFVGLAAILALGAIAWACTPSAYLYPVSPNAGMAGTEVTVRGGQFGNGPVEIRWRSENGRLLTSALGPHFTAKVTIPDRPEGVHYLVAVARDPADPSRILARRAEAFEITSNPGSDARATASLWGEAKQPPADDRGSMATLVGTVGLALAAAGAALVALTVVRRKRAEI